MDALDEIRAERARLEKRALTRRTVFGAIVGLILGGMFGYEVREVVDLRTTGLSAESSIPSGVANLDLASTLDLAKNASDVDLVANYKFFFAVQAKYPDVEDLWAGIERYGLLVVSESDVLSSRHRSLVARSVLVTIEKAQAVVASRLLELEPELRRYAQ